MTNEIRTASLLIYQLTTKLERHNVSITMQLSRVAFKCIWLNLFITRASTWNFQGWGKSQKGYSIRWKLPKLPLMKFWCFVSVVICYEATNPERCNLTGSLTRYPMKHKWNHSKIAFVKCCGNTALRGFKKNLLSKRKYPERYWNRQISKAIWCV